MRGPPRGGQGSLTLVQDSIGRLVPGKGLLGQVLVALGKALHFSQAGVEGHGGVVGVLGHVQVRGPPELLLNDQRLLQQLGVGGSVGPAPPPEWLPSVLHQRPPQAKAPGRKEGKETYCHLLPALAWWWPTLGAVTKLGSLYLITPRRQMTPQWGQGQSKDPPLLVDGLADCFMAV